MKKLIPIIGFILMILWMILIFYMSSRTNMELDSTKSFMLNIMVKIFKGNDFYLLDSAAQNNILSTYSYIVSKTAHFLEYGILCYFCYLAFIYLKKYRIRYIISVLICLIYAITDEYHQSFVSSRTPRVFDVIIDVTGAIMMILLIELVITIINYRRIGKIND